MTMGTLRVCLLIAFGVTGSALIGVGANTGTGDAMTVAVVTSAALLCVPTLRLVRITMDTPLTVLRILPTSVVVFALGMAAPALLMVAPWASAAALAGFVAAYTLMSRTVSAALARHHEVLRPSGGDADLGVFTPLTPMLPPPTSGASSRHGATHSQYDATAAIDPLNPKARRRRTRG